MTKKEYWLIAILASINFTNIMDFMIMMPLQEYLVPVFQITPQQFSYLVASYAISAGTSSITASFIVDRFDRKKTLIFAFTGLIIGTLACSISSTYDMLLGSRIIAGIFGGLIGAQALSIVGDVFPFERRGRAMGFLMTAFALASVVGVPAGLYFAKFSWQFPFIGIGIFGILILPLAIVVVPSLRGHIEQRAADKRKFQIYRSIAKDPNRQRALLMMFTLIISHFSIIPFIAPYLENNVGFTKDQVALMYFVGGIVSFFGSPFIGKLADKHGKHRILLIFLILSTIPIFLMTNLPRMPYYYVLIITGLFFFVAGGRMIPAQALITAVVPSQQRGGFMNITSSLQQFGVGMAAFVAGMIVTKNEVNELVHYEIVGYLGIGISLICAYLSTKVKPLEDVLPDLPEQQTDSMLEKPVQPEPDVAEDNIAVIAKPQ